MTKKTGIQQIPVNVVGSSTYGRFAKISAAKTLNMFISTAGEGDSSEAWLVNFPGYKAVLQILTAGEGRGIFRSIRGNFMLAVINANVYRINENLGATLIGALASDSGEVYMDENLNNQICIVDGTNAYIYNHSLAPNLTIQSLSGSLVPNYVTYHNTFFLFGNGNTTGNGAAWYAYSFASATTISQTTQLALQTKPDYAIAVKRIPSQSANVLVFGTAVCEVHQQVGGIQNYRRVNAISVDYGCLNVSTIDAADQYIAWLGVNEFNAPVIMVYSGQGSATISSDGISYELGKIKFPAQSTAAFVRVDGHLMYQLTFYNEVDNVTYLYDFKTKMFFNLSDQHLNFHPARRYAYFNQKTYFVSLTSTKIYEINPDFTVIDENVSGTDANNIYDMQRIRITDTFAQDDSDRFIANRLTLTIEQGTDPDATGAAAQETNIITEPGFTPPLTDIITEGGIDIVMEGASTAGPAYNPRVDLSISTDGAETWSSTVPYYMNLLGYRRNIMNWNRMGAVNTITFKFRFWGRFRFIVNNAYMEIK
ncbi:MAG: hypothetical protein V4568_18050 [Pseudomonadota bacterium]